MKKVIVLNGANKLYFPFALIYAFLIMQLSLIAAFFISLFRWQLPSNFQFINKEISKEK